MRNSFSKKILVGLMSVALSAVIFSAGTAIRRGQVAAAETETTFTAETDTTQYEGFYTDYEFTHKATGGAIVAYANGNKDYKTFSVYTDVRPTYIFTAKSQSGKTTVKSTASKLLITTSTSGDEKNAPFTTDTTKASVTKVNTKDPGVMAAKSIATAAVRNGIVTVTGQKEAGTVYVWMKDSNPKEKKMYKIPVTIKMAPKKLDLYAETMNDETVKKEGLSTFTKSNINITKQKDIYLYAYNIGTDKAKKGVYKDITFTATLDKNAKDYFEVVPDPNDLYHFSIKALKVAADKKGKAIQFTGKVTFTCDQSGAKSTFTAIAGNHVSQFAWKMQDDNNNDRVSYNVDNKIVQIVPATNGSVTAKFDIVVKKCEVEGEAADKAGVCEITADQMEQIKTDNKFLTDKNGLPKYSLKTNEKSGITAKISGDVVTFTVTKGKPSGKTGYFIVGFTGGTYDIITVQTVEALAGQ